MRKRIISILLILCMILTQLPVSASAVERANGWYTFTLNKDSYVNINADGGAVLRSKVLNEKFYVENTGKFYLESKGKDSSGRPIGTLKMQDGRYLGIKGEIKNGVQLTAVDSPYLWIYDTTGRGLRPSTDYNMIANASGESYKDGTKIILWEMPKNTFGFAPKHADFIFDNTIDPEGITPGLYRVVAFDGTNSQPLYKNMGGSIIGVVPTETILNVIASEGDWVKVEYKDREFYMYMYFKWKYVLEGKATIALKKVDAPTIVCSPWAKEWLSSYTGSFIGTPDKWPNAEENWTKPITRGEMAYLFVEIMQSIWTEYSVQYTLKRGAPGSGEIKISDMSDIKDFTQKFAVDRLAYWGVIPGGKFKPNDKATYGDFTKLLLKLMAYNKKIPRQGTGSDFTQADIDKFAIGGSKKANSNISKEQAVILCKNTLSWYKDLEHVSDVKYQQSSKYSSAGATAVGTGVYTIKTLIGTKPKQPYLTINGKGEGELDNKAQKFKITYKKGVIDNSGEWWPQYTIQTMDGKYLAITGEVENGSRLVTQKKAYLWRIISVGSEDYQWTMDICPVDNMRQFLNASESKTANGTPIITWFWDFGDRGLSPVPSNCQFIFEYISK